MSKNHPEMRCGPTTNILAKKPQTRMLLLITACSFTEVTVIKTETSLNVTKLDS
jgi:hypothetical protein